MLIQLGAAVHRQGFRPWPWRWYPPFLCTDCWGPFILPLQKQDLGSEEQPSTECSLVLALLWSCLCWRALAWLVPKFVLLAFIRFGSDHCSDQFWSVFCRAVYLSPNMLKAKAKLVRDLWCPWCPGLWNPCEPKHLRLQLPAAWVLPDQIKIKKLRFWNVLRDAGVQCHRKAWWFANTYFSFSMLSLKLAKYKWCQVPEVRGGYLPVGLCCCSSNLPLYCIARKGCKERRSGTCLWCLFQSCS